MSIVSYRVGVVGRLDFSVPVKLCVMMSVGMRGHELPWIPAPVAPTE
jgi:hypothetical protein